LIDCMHKYSLLRNRLRGSEIFCAWYYPLFSLAIPDVPVLSILINSRNIRNDLDKKNQENDAFDHVLDDMAGRIHHVNVLTDFVTVFKFNALHSLLRNPNYPETIISFDAYEDRNCMTMTMTMTMTMISSIKVWFPRCEIASSRLSQWSNVLLPW
jgi:hypothetical protein